MNCESAKALLVKSSIEILIRLNVHIPNPTIHFFQTMNFAKDRNLFLAIRSSGHSFIGRSTHDGAIVLNLKNMKGKRFMLDKTDNNPAGEVEVESGNTWLEVYEAVSI